jgi:hypothetical protein
MFLGKIMIAAGTTAAVYAFIQYTTIYTFLSPLLILVVIFSYYLACFCLFICYCSSFYGCLFIRNGYIISMFYCRLN